MIFGTPQIVTNGLVLHLDAGNRKSYVSGSTVWNDLSGRNNSGSLVNGATFSGDNQGSIVFDGNNDYVDTSFSTNFSTADFTLHSWVYPEFNSAAFGRPIITKNGNGGCAVYDFALEYGRQANRFSLLMSGGSGSPNLYTTVVPISNWYNVVATRRFLGGTNYECLIYINGVLNASITGNLTGGNATKMTIGNYIDCSFVNTWLGRIASVQIYNRALSASEIAQNYNALKSRFGLS